MAASQQRLVVLVGDTLRERSTQDIESRFKFRFDRHDEGRAGSRPLSPDSGSITSAT
jgi:hypothetical protein